MTERRILFAVACVVLGPVMVAAGLVAGIAILNEVLAGWLDIGNVFDFSGISWLDWLAGGPGAVSGSGARYIAFMIGGVTASVCFAALAWLFRWMSGEFERDAAILEAFRSKINIRTVEGGFSTNEMAVIEELASTHGVSMEKVRGIVGTELYRSHHSAERAGQPDD